MFELQQVRCAFESTLAVADLNLRIPAGQTVALIGPSGCGKSTLLRLMLGLQAPTAGSITFEGHPVTPRSAPALRRRMGYVIQGGGLFPHLCAADNVELLPRHLGWTRQRIADRRLELGSLARIDPSLWSRYPAQLSGGQAQRIALVRALMSDPDVLLLDEPLGALDPLVRMELQEELRDIVRKLGKTVVLVTHDLGEAAYLADRIVLLRDGSIVQDGGYADLEERPADDFVGAFLRAQRGPVSA